MEQQQPRPDHVVVDIELQAVDVAGDGGDASQRNAVDVVVKPLPTGDIADCRVVDMNLLHVPSVVVGNPTAGSPDCHVADAAAKPGGAKRDGAGSDDDDGSSCCVVCTEPLEWVVVGRCGHRVVCGRCMVRIRFFHQDKRCCVCRTRCPKVLVTRWDAAAAASRGAGNNLPALPRFAFREGRVGKYWYHKLTAAYFEDEQQYDVARAACHGILSAFHQPL
uniref:RING-type domain-containing protein n=1 Tax=Setaria italica TaxID=4555 RepID=K4A312_SETIT